MKTTENKRTTINTSNSKLNEQYSKKFRKRSIAKAETNSAQIILKSCSNHSANQSALARTINAKEKSHSRIIILLSVISTNVAKYTNRTKKMSRKQDLKNRKGGFGGPDRNAR